MRTLAEVLKSHHYHTPTKETQEKITVIRKSCMALAKLIFETCPQHPDTTVALRDLESARMRAISCLAFYSPDSVMIEDTDAPTGASGQLTPASVTDTEQLAREMYDEYCIAVGGVAFNNDKLPAASEFFTDPAKTKQAAAWRMIAENTALKLTSMSN